MLDKLILAGIILGFLVLSAVLGLVTAIPIYYLWNWLMPKIFGLTVITYWEAWGLYFLAAIIFKSSSSSSK